jgi:hypothetical protein
MTHHGNPVFAGFSNRLHVPTTAQCGQWSLATPQRVRFAETTSMSFDMLALAIN